MDKRAILQRISLGLLWENKPPKLKISIDQWTNFYILVFSLYSNLFWELRDKRNLANLQFFVLESLGVMLEYVAYFTRSLANHGYFDFSACLLALHQTLTIQQNTFKSRCVVSENIEPVIKVARSDILE